MLPDRVSNPGPLTCESGALPIALGHPANLPGLQWLMKYDQNNIFKMLLNVEEFRAKHAVCQTNLTLTGFKQG